ncbi:hypothetical protein Sa4125_34000 [Aureimonas sp. SA4125]|nr:hypothetical protein Sa4125_34000 [Aureimonas sp. SA4125]
MGRSGAKGKAQTRGKRKLPGAQRSAVAVLRGGPKGRGKVLALIERCQDGIGLSCQADIEPTDPCETMVTG